MNDKETFTFYLFFILALLTIPFSPNTNAIFVLGFTLINLWIALRYKSSSSTYSRFCISNGLFTLIFFAGLMHTSDMHNAFKTLEARYSLFIFPVLLVLTGKMWNTNLIARLLLCFAITITGCGLIIQCSLLNDLIINKEPLSLFFYWRYSGAALSERLPIHPTYLSMCSILSIAIFYEFLILRRGTRLSFIAGLALMVYLTVLIFHLASRISLVTLVVVGIILLGQVVLRYRWKAILIFLPLGLVSLLLFKLEIFAVKSRLENTIGIERLFLGDTISTNEGDRHVVAWFASMAIIKENYWVGVGSGDVKNSLNYVYNEINAPDLIELNLNSHNQYLGTLLENGVVGILTLFALYWYGLFDLGVKKNLYTIFIIIITITSLTENILDRQLGAVFFGAFNTLLYAFYKNEHVNLNLISTKEKLR